MRRIAVLMLCVMLTGCASGRTVGGNVIHGCGTLWEYDSGGVYRAFAGSNSREAFLRCADRGVGYVEIDFSLTADGEAVCIHGWEREYIREITDGVPMTLSEFEASRIYGCFTPMTASDAAEILCENEELVLVADIKDDFDETAAAIAREFSCMLDRVVVQIYHTEQYGRAEELGFERIAYTLYRLGWDEKTDAEAHIAFARTHDLAWIAMDCELVENSGFIQRMLKADIPLYAHTVNDEKTEQYLLDMGFSGVYTDYIK